MFRSNKIYVLVLRWESFMHYMNVCLQSIREEQRRQKKEIQKPQKDTQVQTLIQNTNNHIDNNEITQIS